MAAQKRHIFVIGCPRSGTTAFTRLLNQHPDIAIGYERYSKLARKGELTPAHFEADRFEQFEAGDSHWSHYNKGNYRFDVLGKAQDASFVGDKLVNVADQMAQFDRFSDVKLIFLIRDPVSIARSWQARADHPNDSWDANRDGLVSIPAFNAFVRFTERWTKANPENSLCIYCEDFFADRSGLAPCLRFIGADPDDMGDADFIYEASAEKLLDPSRTIQSEVSLRANFGRFRKLVHAARTASGHAGSEVVAQ
ncbi:MAG: sulfotransferase [Pseudomonadota bacterium]